MTTKHENSFDFLRLIAALFVVVGHAVRHYDTKFLWHSDSDPFWFTDGVALFFILSGFLVYKSCDNTIKKNISISQYFKKRFLRVVPAIYVYLIITTLSFLLLGIVSFNTIDRGFILWFMSTVLLVPVYYPSSLRHFGIGVTNGSLWTIPVEISFYIALPIFVLIKNKFGFKKMSIFLFTLAIGSLVGYQLLLNTFTSEAIFLKLLNISFLPHLIFFATGILFSKIWSRLPESGWLALFSLFLYYVLKNISILNQPNTIFLSKIFIAFPLAYCIFWFGYNGPSICYRFTSKIGDISYGVYLWHMIVINYIIYFNINSVISGNLLIFVTLVISIILGLLSWHLVEKKFLMLKVKNN